MSGNIVEYLKTLACAVIISIIGYTFASVSDESFPNEHGLLSIIFTAFSLGIAISIVPAVVIIYVDKKTSIDLSPFEIILAVAVLFVYFLLLFINTLH